MSSDRAGEQDMVGRLLRGRYRLASVLGQGGMGTVWRAKDEVLGRDVAVKQLRFAAGMDEDERHRLVARALTEAKAIARIRHTAAVTVYDVVEEDDRPWIVMELVESRSLSEVIRADGVLSPRRAAEIGLDLLGVLAEAHRSGILHRDVKPSNVLIGHHDEAGRGPSERAGGGEAAGRVVLTDFGIARVEGDPSVTSTGMLVGAPSYISPERARGGIPGAPADLWSLGATLYAMVEGYPPYDKGSALSTLTAVMTEELTPPRNGGALTPVIEGLLRKDPKQRLDVAAARRMLQSVLDAPEATAAPTIASRPPGAARTTPPGAAAAFGAGAGPAAAAAPPRRQPAPPEPTMASPTPAGRPVRAVAVPPGAGATLPPTRSGSVRRRVGKPLLALLVVLLVVAAGVFAAHHGKHNTAHPGSGDRATTHPTAPGSAPPSASAGSSPAASAPASAPAATGFHRVQGPGGASLEIPTGWVLMKQSGSSWTYKGLAGTLQIDATSTPGSSAVGAWQSEESAISRSFTNYQRVRLETVTYRGGWDAADWEWTYSRGGTTLHALNRGFVTDARHGYAIYWTAADSTWSGARNQELLHRFFSSFQPAG